MRKGLVRTLCRLVAMLAFFACANSLTISPDALTDSTLRSRPASRGQLESAPERRASLLPADVSAAAGALELYAPLGVDERDGETDPEDEDDDLDEETPAVLGGPMQNPGPTLCSAAVLGHFCDLLLSGHHALDPRPPRRA